MARMWFRLASFRVGYTVSHKLAKEYESTAKLVQRMHRAEVLANAAQLQQRLGAVGGDVRAPGWRPARFVRAGASGRVLTHHLLRSTC